MPPEVEFEKNDFEGGIFEQCLFMKKDKLVHGTIFLNVVDYWLHDVTCVETAKDAWDNLQVQDLKEDMLATNCNYIKSFTILR